MVQLVAAAAFFGLATGFLGKIVKIENFNGAKIVKFIVGEVIISLISWVALAPIIDIAIYKEPQRRKHLHKELQRHLEI